MQDLASGTLHQVLRPTSAPAVQGSIERAMAQLGAYRTDLEERVVALFDQAGAAGDLRTMAGCCTIMADCQRGAHMLAEVGPSACCCHTG